MWEASGRPLGGIWGASGRHLRAIWDIWGHLVPGGIRRHLGGIWEASGRHLGGIWEASGGHLGGIWKASEGHLGGIWGASEGHLGHLGGASGPRGHLGDEMCQNHRVFSAKVARATVSRTRERSDSDQVRSGRTKVGRQADDDSAPQSKGPYQHRQNPYSQELFGEYSCI